MQAATTFQRTPLVITAGSLVAGPVNASFSDGNRESLLHSYLVLVRQLRGQQREPSITLRGEDISLIAEHLGVSDERVLEDLLDRMGATRAQRKALLAVFALGALSIVATGSVALDLAPAGVLAQSLSDVELVIETVERATASVSTTTDFVADVAPVVAAGPGPAEVFPEPEVAIAVGGAEWEFMVSLEQLTYALSTQPAADLGVAAAEGVGITDDGLVVAVAPPPVATPEGVGVTDDGSIVAVAPPPVATPEGVGVADDGSIVAVGPPPMP